MLHPISNRLDYTDRVALPICQTHGEEQKVLVPLLCCPSTGHAVIMTVHRSAADWIKSYKKSQGDKLLRIVLQLDNGFVLQFQPITVQKWKNLLLPALSSVIWNTKGTKMTYRQSSIED